jgi:hypothetical protein
MTPSASAITTDVVAGLANGLFATVATALYRDVGMIVGVGGLVITALAAILRELFWLRALDRSERHQRWLLERGADPDAVARLVGLADQARGHVVATRTGRPSAKAVGRGRTEHLEAIDRAVGVADVLADFEQEVGVEADLDVERWLVWQCLEEPRVGDDDAVEP